MPSVAQKLTMLIEVVPRPRLNIMRKIESPGADARGPVNDPIMHQSFDDAALNAEVLRPCFAFDILPEDCNLLNSEQIESLFSGSQETDVPPLSVAAGIRV
jgi:hypothetical protein